MQSSGEARTVLAEVTLRCKESIDDLCHGDLSSESDTAARVALAQRWVGDTAVSTKQGYCRVLSEFISEVRRREARLRDAPAIADGSASSGRQLGRSVSDGDAWRHGSEAASMVFEATKSKETAMIAGVLAAEHTQSRL